MNKLTITERQLFIAGFISLAFISSGSMVGTWIGITGLIAVSILLMHDPFDATELQGQLDEEWHQLELAHAQREEDEYFAKMANDMADQRRYEFFARMTPEQRADWATLEAEDNEAGRDAEAERGDYRV